MTAEKRNATNPKETSMSHGKAHNAARRPRTVLQWIIQITGELLITAGVILLLFVAWQLWWTNIAPTVPSPRPSAPSCRSLTRIRPKPAQLGP